MPPVFLPESQENPARKAGFRRRQNAASDAAADAFFVPQS